MVKGYREEANSDREIGKKWAYRIRTSAEALEKSMG